LLREHDISTKKFRELTNGARRLLAYEGHRRLSAREGRCSAGAAGPRSTRISGRKVTVVPILRAGLGMLDGVLDMVPTPRSAWSACRATTRRCSPSTTSRTSSATSTERTALIIDPMLATAGSMIATVDLLQRQGCSDIRALVLVAAPERVAALDAAHPDVRCWTAAIDSHLNEHGYIIPGLRRRRRTASSGPRDELRGASIDPGRGPRRRPWRSPFGCTQETQNHMRRDIQNWTGTNGVPRGSTPVRS
jgi:uracil phosphoribosyltransferase